MGSALRAGCTLLWVLTALSCNPEKSAARKPPPAAPAEKIDGKALLPTSVTANHSLSSVAWAALLDLTSGDETDAAPDESLIWLAAGLQESPSSEEMRLRALRLLAKGVWHLPVVLARHPLSMDFIDTQGTDICWVGLVSEGIHTLVRWNLRESRVESVLFPLHGAHTDFWRKEPTGRRVVIGRGGNLLLCDAVTLKPVREIASLPPDDWEEPLVAFSQDGLLLGHATVDATAPGGLLWTLRDSQTGEILRSTACEQLAGMRPLACSLDRNYFRLLLNDGSFWLLPISPAEPPTTLPPPSASGHWLAAWFPSTGGSWLGLHDDGPHRTPAVMEISVGPPRPWIPEAQALLRDVPWSPRNQIWNGMLRLAGGPPLKIGDRQAAFGPWVAPLRTATPLTALAALDHGRWVTGEAEGTMVIHQTVPAPTSKARTAATPPPRMTPKALAALNKTVWWLTRRKLDTATGKISTFPPELEVAAPLAEDLAALEVGFPELDFGPWRGAVATWHVRTIPETALGNLVRRLDRSWPTEHTEGIDALREKFTQGDSAVVEAAIQQAGSDGQAAANALKLALAADRPEWIQACLREATQVPPLLRRLADSRIAWLQGRKADALAPWPDSFPDMQEIRRHEDWDGWEQADFSPEYQAFQETFLRECATLTIPAGANATTQKQVASRLADPTTVQSFGRARVAQACLAAAAVLSLPGACNEEAFQLAGTARMLGAEPVPCLRAEAIALTALGRYREARECWVTLITEHPVPTHVPGDYAEAAYTAFENSDPRQAMAILTTGMHRFPDDAHFALRAGWVALLTGNPHPAYRFLLAGRRIGYPKEKLENATALLAIAAAKTGSDDDAAAFYQDLLQLDPAWKIASTLQLLHWPDDLKASLLQLMQQSPH